MIQELEVKWRQLAMNYKQVYKILYNHCNKDSLFKDDESEMLEPLILMNIDLEKDLLHHEQADIKAQAS